MEGNMDQTSTRRMYRIEGLFISILMIVALVVFYYRIIDKYVLTTLLLGMSSCLFSINTSLQQTRGSVAIVKLNIFLTYIFALAAIGFAVYFYISGCFVF